jgi:predicted DNA-binding ArsR family transcriptional regulator
MSDEQLKEEVEELKKLVSHNDSKIRSKLDYLLKHIQMLRADIHESSNAKVEDKPCCGNNECK